MQLRRGLSGILRDYLLGQNNTTKADCVEQGFFCPKELDLAVRSPLRLR